MNLVSSPESLIPPHPLQQGSANCNPQAKSILLSVLGIEVLWGNSHTFTYIPSRAVFML